MRSLALAGVFLAATQACIFCRLPDRDLSGRLARLCSQMEAQWKEWASPDFSAFALDEVTMNKVTEKTHRVLRVIEDPDPPVHQGSSLCSGLPGQHHPVQLLHLQECRGVLLAPKALLSRKSRSLGSQDSAPLRLRSCPAPGRSEPPGGVPTPPSRQVTGEMLTAASKRGIPHTSTSSPPWSQPS
ncbi:sperm-egg fusion protein TMEM95 isoform X1 [Oryctolagus cuniculus]|uniref:sperm-egg fusion protein TMEM95 isoform X1 n=1 Tax=Oryctolagus cuniculus TaxID=9986 RepID=UPI003879CC50